MSQQEKTVKFRYVPCIFFKCIHCNHTLQVERLLPDITSTGRECLKCRCVYYRVAWGALPDETKVIAEYLPLP